MSASQLACPVPFHPVPHPPCLSSACLSFLTLSPFSSHFNRIHLIPATEGLILLPASACSHPRHRPHPWRGSPHPLPPRPHPCPPRPRPHPCRLHHSRHPLCPRPHSGRLLGTHSRPGSHPLHLCSNPWGSPLHLRTDPRGVHSTHAWPGTYPLRRPLALS